MPRSRTATAAICVLVALPSCSLLIDTNPDGVIKSSASGAAGRAAGGTGAKAGASDDGGVTNGGAGGLTSATNAGGTTVGTSSGGALATAGNSSVGGAVANGGSNASSGTALTPGGTTGIGASAAIGGAGASGGTSISVAGSSATIGGAGNGSGGATTSGVAGTTTGGMVSTGGATGVGGTSATGGSSSTSIGGASGDTTPPTVISISPINGATGVADKASIVVTFSETMDTASVVNAVATAPLAKSAFSLAWSLNNSVLTLTPIAGLTYATGTTSATTTAQAYNLSISTAARDLAGNSMLTQFSSTFATLRRITQILQAETVSGWNTYSDAMGDSPVVCGADPGRFQLGTWDNGHNGGTYYGFIYYDISTLDLATTGSAIEQATFRAIQAAPSTGFYPNGSVILERLDYQPLDNSILPSTPTATLGTLCTSNASQPQLDVTASFSVDFVAARQKILYQMAASGSVLGEYSWFLCNGFTLRVTYTTP